MVKLNEEIMKLRDDVRGKDAEIDALTQKFLEKGSQN
jgi:hypothetical protein